MRGTRVAVVLALLLPGGALARDARLSEAIQAYDQAQLEQARDLMGALVVDPGLSKQDQFDARKYLAATYMALGDPAAARAQLSIMVSIDPDQVLDPAIFVPELVGLHEELRVRAIAERDAKLEEQRKAEEAAAAKRAEEERKRQAEEEARRLAEQKKTPPPSSNGWLRWVGIGVGGAAAATGGVLLNSSWATHRELKRGADARQPTVRKRDGEQAQTRAAVGVGLIAGGLAVGLAGAAFPLMLEDDAPAMSVSVGPDGVFVGATVEWDTP